MSLKLSKVIRLDSLPLPEAYFTSEGYLIDRPILTSTGIFEYVNPDGSVRYELRLPEEVFAEESLASYQGKPVIITHDAEYVTKDNVQNEMIGTILTSLLLFRRIRHHQARQRRKCPLQTVISTLRLWRNGSIIPREVKRQPLRRLRLYIPPKSQLQRKTSLKKEIWGDETKQGSPNISKLGYDSFHKYFNM